MVTSISKEQINDLPLESFRGKIHVINTIEEANQATKKLQRCAMLGFDTETRPSFRKGVKYKVALLQLANRNSAYLFRLNLIGMPQSLQKLLENPRITKIGLSLKDDFAAIEKKTNSNHFAGFIDLQETAPQYGITEKSLQKIYAILFHKKISKNQRLSNWAAATLSDGQKTYAAIDAWACLRIYKHLCNLKQNKKATK